MIVGKLPHHLSNHRIFLFERFGTGLVVEIFKKSSPALGI
jgi:hypothetical protein